LKAVIDNAHRANSTVDREKLWVVFHKERSEHKFCKKWKELLTHCDVPYEPVLFQHLTLLMFKAMLVFHLPLPSTTSESPTELTFEEVNAIRYMGGYIVRSFLKVIELDYLVKEAPDRFATLKESEDWTCSVDRGGLIHITDSFCQTLCSIERAVRQSISTVGTFCKTKVNDAVIGDSDVLFHWCLASQGVEEDEKIVSIHFIAEKWITIRGFSFAKSVLEKFKQDNKKNVEKSKPLRTKIAQSEA